MIPTDPNSSFTANLNPVHRRIAPLCPITHAQPIEEMEEKEMVNFQFRTMFVINPPRNRRRDVALSPQCSTN
jgi:hypothetical protein